MLLVSVIRPQEIKKVKCVIHLRHSIILGSLACLAYLVVPRTCRNSCIINFTLRFGNFLCSFTTALSEDLILGNIGVLVFVQCRRSGQRW